MTERKFTDEEVLKALECCTTSAPCKECPYYAHPACTVARSKDALDLINRQRAEIESLNEIVFTDRTEAIKMLKAEAIKEFAERLKERFFNYYEGLNENTSKSNYHGETLMFYEVADMIENCIENLVEEMTEGKPCTEGADCFAAEGKE